MNATMIEGLGALLAVIMTVVALYTIDTLSIRRHRRDIMDRMEAHWELQDTVLRVSQARRDRLREESGQ